MTGIVLYGFDGSTYVRTVRMLLAEKGARDIYERAQSVIDIKRTLNLHFNFAHYEQIDWLDAPNPRLQGMTFRHVMQRDIRFATEIIDSLLQD